jgi:transcription initiation factor TFIIIB Brf1 subunit/transcription initiation factor TFIIB
MFKKVMFSKLGSRKNIGDHVTTKPKDVVVRLLNNFDVTREDRFKIMKICYETERCVELMSKTPKAVAACVIYTVLNKSGVMKTEITSVCDVSLPTLNKIEGTLKLYLETNVK